jgi:hypothetical protein
MGNYFFKGTGLQVLEEASRTGNQFSEDFHFADPGGAEIIIEITDASGGGSITGLVVQDKIGSGAQSTDYVDTFDFGVLVITAAGKYQFAAYPSQLDAASYTADPVNQIMPTNGRLKLLVTGTLQYKIKMRNLGR